MLFPLSERVHINVWSLYYRGNIFPKCSSNFEVDASELLENLEKCFLCITCLTLMCYSRFEPVDTITKETFLQAFSSHYEADAS